MNTETDSRGDGEMTGQRHETSVLFSLTDLRAMGSREGPLGHAASAGSGLIDIRAMARHAVEAPPPSALAPGDAAPVASPVQPALLLPLHQPTTRSWRWPLLIGAVLGLALSLAIAIVAVRDGAKALESAAAPVSPVLLAPTVPAAQAPTQPRAPAAASLPALAPAPARHTPPARRARRTKRTRRTRRARRQTKRQRRPRRSPRRVARGLTAKPAAKPAAKPTKQPRGGDLDRLLDEATKGRQSAAPRAAKPLPARLGRSQIVDGMRGVGAAVSGCYARYRVPGTALARVSVAASGKVTAVRLKGRFANTPTGRCLVQAVRRARFARCQGPTTITYAFPLR
jgi:hypothetical protein